MADMGQKTAEERFWSKVDKAGPVFEDLGPCWLWIGALEGNGYGTFWKDGRLGPAHRVAWEWAHGPIPAGRELDHLCRVRRCVNDGHLDVVTHRENLMRGNGVCARNARKTACGRCGGAFRVRMNGKRQCSRCRNARQARRRLLGRALAQGW